MEEARPMVRTLFLAVAVVLFIACANLASLLLVRVIRRRREIAVRLALGANAGVVIRQNLIEALVLSVAGGLLGLGLAAVALRAGLSFLPETLPRISSITLDWQVMFFALLLAVFTGFLCGLLPAWSASRTNLNDAIKEGGRTGTSGGGHVRLRSMLVIAEVAVALVFLTAAGLLLRSFDKLRAVNLGFQTDHTLTALYSLPQRQYSTQASVDEFNNALMEKLRQAPGVKTAGVTTQLPSGGSSSTTVFVVEGYVPPKGADLSLAWQSQIIGDYFRAAGIPLLRGREFTDADNAKSPLVVVVNQSMAQHYWRGQDPIGKRVRWGLPESPTPWLTVVGEIGDIKQNGADLPTKEQIYQPSSQGVASFGSLVPAGILNGNGGSIVMRTMLPPEEMANALRSAVHSIDPQLALTQVESMDQVVAEGEASRRFNTMLISSFAAAAVLLALLGIYSVIAFSAAMRTQDRGGDHDLDHPCLCGDLGPRIGARDDSRLRHARLGVATSSQMVPWARDDRLARPAAKTVRGSRMPLPDLTAAARGPLPQLAGEGGATPGLDPGGRMGCGQLFWREPDCAKAVDSLRATILAFRTPSGLRPPSPLRGEGEIREALRGRQ